MLAVELDVQVVPPDSSGGCFAAENLIPNSIGFNDRAERQNIRGASLVNTVTYQRLLDVLKAGASRQHSSKDIVVLCGYISLNIRIQLEQFRSCHDGRMKYSVLPS